MKEEISEYMKRHPEVAEEMRYNIETYGVPFLAGGQGDIDRGKVGEEVMGILNGDQGSKLMELVVHPEDAEGTKYCVHWHVLRWDKLRGFERAIDYELSGRGKTKRGTGDGRPKVY